jgi:hypothetical protein
MSLAFEPVCGVANPHGKSTWQIQKAPYILLMMVEDVMDDHTDTHSLYVLLAMRAPKANTSFADFPSPLAYLNGQA